MTARRIRGRAGVEANARLTAMTGIVLLVLFIAEIATVLMGARSVLTLHVTLGLLLVPPVLLKIASTTCRMAAYYRGDTGYREKGPPALALRILGPFLVFLTMLVFVSGIGLIVGLRPLHGSFLIVHRASFYLWLVTPAIHVAAHSKTVVYLAGKDIVRHTRMRTARARYRLLTLTRTSDTTDSLEPFESMEHRRMPRRRNQWEPLAVIRRGSSFTAVRACRTGSQVS